MKLVSQAMGIKEMTIFLDDYYNHNSHCHLGKVTIERAKRQAGINAILMKITISDTPKIIERISNYVFPLCMSNGNKWKKMFRRRK